MTAGTTETKQRIIQEYVPGKQVTLAHVIARPQKGLHARLRLENETSEAIGILTITPGEGVIIAADLATTAAAVEVGFLDYTRGSLLVQGDVASVEAALRDVVEYFKNTLQYAAVDMTRS